jgi:excisionase family DNA binding protein
MFNESNAQFPMSSAHAGGATTLIDINELSRRLSVPKGTLYNWCYLKRIPFIKAGRSLRFDLDEVIQSLPHSPILDLAGKR